MLNEDIDLILIQKYDSGCKNISVNYAFPKRKREGNFMKYPLRESNFTGMTASLKNFLPITAAFYIKA